jgi:large subunit ribosomal protein L20
MRIKRGVASHKKHKKIRKLTKGYSHPNRVSIKRGKQTIIKALQYSTRDRKNKKRTLRQLWNIRINIASKANGINYSQLINGLKQRNIAIDRKILSELATNEPSVFTEIVKKASLKN